MDQDQALLLMISRQVSGNVDALNAAIALLQSAIMTLQADIVLIGASIQQIVPKVNAIDAQLSPAAPLAPTLTPQIQAIIIAWNAVSGAVSYNIYWSTSPGVTTLNGTKIPVTNTYTLTLLVTGQKYYFVMTALNAAGESPLSPEVSATAL
jgi:hypothetical protein